MAGGHSILCTGLKIGAPLLRITAGARGGAGIRMCVNQISSLLGRGHTEFQEQT